ncbi:MAG: 2OG-Fe(II) oxygenase [Burkholderiales bacterium]
MDHEMTLELLADRAAEGIREKGWCIVDEALPPSLALALAETCAGSDAFKTAGTGRQQDYYRDASVRSDVIRWLNTGTAADAQYLQAMEVLRLALNSRLYLGLLDYECHYARYAPGAFYRKHVDAFAGRANRVLSTVYYLNADWREEEGGELALYAKEGAEPVERVLPQLNRLVVFLSEGFPHEVKPATRARHSIAGWFRIRS